MGACDSVSNKENVEDIRFLDMTGVYRVFDTDDGVVPSITSMQVNTGASSNEATVQIFRNGLSYDERNYFADLGLLEWADSEFGRELSLGELKEGETEKNTVDEDGVGILNVCTQKKSYSDLAMDFIYCIEIIKEDDQTALDGDLVLYAFENNIAVDPIDIEYSLFEQDRLSVDYFGNWTGEITKEGAYFFNLTLATGSDLRITFQPINQSEYIVRPVDANQNITLYNESFVLSPFGRPQSELENNANPYINFIYVSELDGNKIIRFNSTVIRRGRIEGNVELVLSNGDIEILARYWLEKD